MERRQESFEQWGVLQQAQDVDMNGAERVSPGTLVWFY